MTRFRRGRPAPTDFATNALVEVLRANDQARAWDLSATPIRVATTCVEDSCRFCKQTNNGDASLKCGAAILGAVQSVS